MGTGKDSAQRLVGSYKKNRNPKANMQITFILDPHMIGYYFIVKLRSFFQLHKYKYNIKFVVELSSEVLVKLYKI